MNMVVKDEIYIVKGIRISPCKCCVIELDVGIMPIEQDQIYWCVDCGFTIPDLNIWWFSSTLFRPIDYTFAEEAIEKAFQETCII